MNSLKNLMIIGVLAAVGYGVYVSLSRNNVDSEQPFAGPKVDMSNAKASLPHGLPLSGSSIPPAAASGSGTGGLGVPTPPPLGSASPEVANAGPVVPYASSGPSATLTPPALSPPTPPAGLTAGSGASLGAPVSPEAAPSTPSSIGAAGPALTPDATTPSAGVVRNLAPPPDATPGATLAATPGVTATAIAVPMQDPTKAVDNSSLQNSFNALMDAVRKKLDEGKFAEAHLALSGLYGDPNLPAEQTKQITDLLDQLAGTVIYSRQHYLAPAYMTQAGDTLDTVAQKYNIPWQLLGKINGLMPPNTPNSDNTVKDVPLPVGKELKVMQGPFDAVVQLDKRELTLMVQNRYAARFRIGVGHDQPKLEGEYTVRNKTLNPTYYGPDGTNIAPSDAKNPLGAAWIGLSDRVGIHGTADPQNVGRDNNRGTICVGDRDLQDLYGILSVGSRITIVK